MNAKQEYEICLRRIAYLETEAKIALVHYSDARRFQIFSDSADVERDQAEQWKRKWQTKKDI